MPKATRVPTSHLPLTLAALASPATRVRMLRLVGLFLVLGAQGTGLSACERRVSPVREWQPTDHGQPEQADPSRTPPAAEAEPEEGGPERAADALYSVTCASCHGRDGRGQGTQRPPGAALPDFTASAYQSQRSDVQLHDAIRDGRGLMPAFGKQLPASSIDMLVARIRRFAPAK
ncbi:MAG: cytochrome c [Polyangiales bacterium]